MHDTEVTTIAIDSGRLLDGWWAKEWQLLKNSTKALESNLSRVQLDIQGIHRSARLRTRYAIMQSKRLRTNGIVAVNKT